MPSHAVVEALRVLKDGLPGLSPTLKGRTIDTFLFECAEKGFSHRIIVAVARSTHAHSDLPPKLWSSESLGYTIPEEGKYHAKGAKDVHSRV